VSPRGAGVALLLAALVAPLGCQQQRQAPATPLPVPRAASPVDEAKTLIGQGQLDAALAKLEAAPSSADSLYYQGVILAKKAETAPLPTPPPAPSPLPKGAEPPPAPEFKPEELKALERFESALSADSGHALSHLAIAELLGPHAVHQKQLAEEAAKRPKPPVRRGHVPEPEPSVPAPVGPDYSAERVIREYQQALQKPGAPPQAREGMITFCIRMGRLEEADAAFREITRNQEKSEPYVRYGDFLLNDKKDREAALDQYKQALVWKADDEATRSKIADIYIAMGAEYYQKQQYAIAETRLREAEPFVADRNSPQGLRLKDYLGRLAAIRAVH
jgi:tetratricopeptide (TPR) repeat protein